MSEETERRKIVMTGYDGSVGPYGFATAGGIGPLARLHGNAADSLLGAELVLANGTLVKVDPRLNKLSKYFQ